MNYREFSVEDFIWDENFRQWVFSPDADSDLFWKGWMTNNPDKLTDINAAQQILKSIRIKNGKLSDYEIGNTITSVLNEINAETHHPEMKLQVKTTWKFQAYKHPLRIAASLIVLLSIAGFYYFKYDPEIRENMFERTNSGPGLLHLNMDDGSKIVLEKGAKLSYSKSFNRLANRKVYLTGEAFFDVAKDPLKPFVVYSNGLITKVLGTKFRIRSNRSERGSTVEVTSGVVAVYSLYDKDSEDEKNAEKLNSVILTRNQRANYSNEDRTVMATIVEQPIAINNKIFNYTFSDTPIRQIFENIEDGYGIEIIYDEKVLAERTLTADLSQVSMYNKLSIICKVLNTHYELIDGKIIIYSN